MRERTVHWRCGLMYAAAGVLGAIASSSAGRQYAGQRLLFLFALLMATIGVFMLHNRRDAGTPGTACCSSNAGKALGFELGTGALSGFFGIGGRFLIVPGLIAFTDMPILNTIAD